MTMKYIFITGASSGLGLALAEAYLNRGWTVYAVSRRTPDNLLSHHTFHHATLDLRDHNRTPGVIADLLGDLDHLDLAILNAGIMGRIEDMANTGLDELKEVMDVNVWANKTVIDSLFSEIETIDQIVTISSGASVNGNRGWSGYSVSKAALNMLTKLYAREHPDTHFCALAPGVIDTAIQEEIRKTPTRSAVSCFGKYPPQTGHAGHALTGGGCGACYRRDRATAGVGRKWGICGRKEVALTEVAFAKQPAFEW